MVHVYSLRFEQMYDSVYFLGVYGRDNENIMNCISKGNTTTHCLFQK